MALAEQALTRRPGTDAGAFRARGRFSHFLLSFDLPALVVVASVVSVVSSEFIASAVSLVMLGKVPPVVIVAAFVTPAVIAPLVSLALVTVVAHFRREAEERRRAEDALRTAIEIAESANKTKSAFLANTSHELRTPLNSVIGFSEMIRDGIEARMAPEKILEYTGHIHESGRHLLAVLNDILDFSKVEAGKLQLYEEEIDLESVVRSSLAPVRNSAEEGGVELVARIPPDLSQVWADPRKLKQVLINLLSNSVKFTPAGGTVITELRETATGVIVITVADTGIGIAAEDIPTALSPFSQVDSALNRKFEGTGLGLPLAKALVELHQGLFSLTSEPGVGTTVEIRLPPARTRRRAPRPNAGRQIKSPPGEVVAGGLETAPERERATRR